ncbi:hypothetical protein M514_20710 [Trichuris suis]|uniref:Uncharacterized protein n=1 Tax=Trichuris suis TaxID=68888 RepID=A0A085NC94_9BILA|nr:hypothetical protein M514_20710 [Trichuris suis]
MNTAKRPPKWSEGWQFKAQESYSNLLVILSYCILPERYGGGGVLASLSCAQPDYRLRKGDEAMKKTPLLQSVPDTEAIVHG